MRLKNDAEARLEYAHAVVCVWGSPQLAGDAPRERVSSDVRFDVPEYRRGTPVFGRISRCRLQEIMPTSRAFRTAGGGWQPACALAADTTDLAMLHDEAGISEHSRQHGDHGGDEKSGRTHW